MSKTVHPGIVWGNYPQNHSQSIGFLESVFSNVSRLLKFKAIKRYYNWHIFYHHYKKRCALLDNDAGKSLVDIKALLLKKGLNNKTIACAFVWLLPVFKDKMDLEPTPAQIRAAYCLLNGDFVEIESGQHMSINLAAIVAVLSGSPVHIVRSSEDELILYQNVMQEILDSLNISTGVIKSNMKRKDKVSNYRKNIVYCSAKELVYDYLHDSVEYPHCHRIKDQLLSFISKDKNKPLLPGLNFVILDNMGQILIDDSGYYLSIAAETQIDANSKLTNNVHYKLLELVDSFIEKQDFSINEINKSVDFTECGMQKMNDSVYTLGGLWSGRSRALQFVSLGLFSRFYLKLDKHYIMEENRLRLLPEFADEAQSYGFKITNVLSVLAVINGASVENARETIARISFQDFFQRYSRLCGIDSELKKNSSEIWSVYHKVISSIKTHSKKLVSYDFFLSYDEKECKLIDMIKAFLKTNQCVIIYEESEQLAIKLKDKLLSENITVDYVTEFSGDDSTLHDVGYLANYFNHNKVFILNTKLIRQIESIIDISSKGFLFSSLIISSGLADKRLEKLLSTNSMSQKVHFYAAYSDPLFNIYNIQLVDWLLKTLKPGSFFFCTILHSLLHYCQSARDNKLKLQRNQISAMDSFSEKNFVFTKGSE